MDKAIVVCRVCAEGPALNFNGGRFMADSAITSVKDGYSYCARHRCSSLGCLELRANLSWHCDEHIPIIASKQGAQSKAAPGSPTANDPPKPKQRACQICTGVFTDLDNIIPSDGPAYCSRHRCNRPGCLKAREKNPDIPHAKWLWWTASDVKTYNWTCHEHRTSNATASNAVPFTSRHCGTCGSAFVDTESPESIHGLSHCSRHRCTWPGCVRHREVDGRGVGWVCINHKILNELPSQPQAFQKIPPRETKQPPPTTQDPLNDKRPCQACFSCKIDNGTYTACSRHRCIQPGCTEPRVDLWVCEAHRQSKPIGKSIGIPTKGNAALDTPPPPTKKRHSRVQSLFNWKFRLQNRKDDHAAIVLETPPVLTETKMKEPSTEKPRRTLSVSTQEPPTPLGTEQPEVGWHQCHAPACQNHVLSEEVWVCQKHLDQGHYDTDDPPGFVDCPIR
ncbi:hypothetical protein QQZ08_002124 [Neonectria magnoliae]|uniref:C2H2-type domain-containing protein n=1 Tax=Neonectria magnoliae TaxID=2732573 RepID=A0ABR1ICM1_9HYPO